MISIVMTSWNRPALLRNTLESIKKQVYGELYPVARLEVEVIVVDTGIDTETKTICAEYGAKRIDMQSATYRNPSSAINAGLKEASGEVVILGNAECVHIDPNTIESLAVLCTDTNAVFAHVFSLNQDGSKAMVYCGVERPAMFFFCGAMKSALWKRFQFDEDFVEPEYDDDDFAIRLREGGIAPLFTDIEVHHQYHERLKYDQVTSKALFLQKHPPKVWGRPAPSPIPVTSYGAMTQSYRG